MRLTHAVLIAASLLCSAPAQSQSPQAPAERIAAQRDAMGRFAARDGTWRGQATMTLPDGQKHEIIQTERVGGFLDGALKMVEGRGYEADGKLAFNALGVISYDPGTKAYSMQSTAQGYTGNFVLSPIPDGFAWEIPAGPMTIKYTATVKDGVWHEVGDRIMSGKQPVRFFDMTLKRIGSTTWPAGDPVPAKQGFISLKGIP